MMFGMQKRFMRKEHDDTDEIHKFQKFDDFKRDFDADRLRRGIVSTKLPRPNTAIQHKANEEEVFQRLRGRLTRLNPKMKVEDFVNRQDSLSTSMLDDSFSGDPYRAVKPKHNPRLNQSYDQPGRQTSGRKIIGKANVVQTPYKKPVTNQLKTRKEDPEGVSTPSDKPIAARRNTNKSILHKIDTDLDFVQPSHQNSFKPRVSLKKVSEYQSQKRDSVHSQSKVTPQSTPSGLSANRTLLNEVFANFPGAKHVDSTSDYSKLTAAEKFDKLYSHFKNPEARLAVSDEHNTKKQKPPKGYSRENSRSKIELEDRLPTIKESKPSPTNKTFDGKLTVDKGENSDNDSASLIEMSRTKKKNNVTFIDEQSNNVGNTRSKSQGVPQRPMDNIKRKFEKEVKFEINKRVNLNSKAMVGSMQRTFDKLQRKFDYLEMRTYKVKPRKYDFEDYLKTLYGKDVTLKDYIATQIKKSVSQKQKDQELSELSSFLKGQNAVVEPEAQKYDDSL